MKTFLLSNKIMIWEYFFIGRVYNGGSQDELATLETCTLLDVFEQDLKSKEN